ncbi:MAG TPA: hypothetical protein VG817_12150 [Gemmatimonadales bacterium]|nr:hypothetical protein [Gemmatimonadales bacterium]
MKALLAVPLALASLTPAASVVPSSHFAHVEGAAMATVAGRAVFGQTTRSCVLAAQCPGSFSLELGAYSEDGAVVFSRVSSARPEVGTYKVSPFTNGPEKDSEFHALVSLGSVQMPAGVFRAVSGTVTITQSTENRVAGHYEVKAIGFLASQPELEDRVITVRGGFTAEPAAMRSMYAASMHGAITSNTMGAAEFGSAGRGPAGMFSLNLGSDAARGAVLLSRSGADRPAVGVYRVRDLVEAMPGDFHGVVSTGGANRPSGVFHARSGSLTITSSTAERLTGTFELRGVGFLAEDPSDDDKEILVAGSFSATANGTTITLTEK